jgi:hypothetical protein
MIISAKIIIHLALLENKLKQAIMFLKNLIHLKKKKLIKIKTMFQFYSKRAIRLVYIYV